MLAAGFVVADVRTLDKQQGSYRQVTSTAIKQDLVIFKEDGVGLVLQSAQRVPANSFKKIFLQGFPNQT